MGYKCKHFVIQELVDSETYAQRGEKAWELLDDRILRYIDSVRDVFGPLTINNWHVGGDREWSGLRTVRSPYYSPYSQHSFGRALDAISFSVSAEEMRDWVLENKQLLPMGGVELGVNWLHVDLRNYDGVKTFTA